MSPLGTKSEIETRPSGPALWCYKVASVIDHRLITYSSNMLSVVVPVILKLMSNCMLKVTYCTNIKLDCFACKTCFLPLGTMKMYSVYSVAHWTQDRIRIPAKTARFGARENPFTPLFSLHPGVNGYRVNWRRTCARLTSCPGGVEILSAASYIKSCSHEVVVKHKSWVICQFHLTG
jgi:hypothetical protein